MVIDEELFVAKLKMIWLTKMSAPQMRLSHAQMEQSHAAKLVGDSR
jgi:hypothetical protein